MDTSTETLRTVPDAYMPQLDAVRAFSILAVLVAHYTSLVYYADFGVLGVQCFFVLSGFLITGLLMQGRKYSDSGLQSPAFTLRQFYARRFLRIFPAYYLMLLASAAIGFGNVREVLPWHLTYTTNFYIAFTASHTSLGHFWSLSVEEQFYLLWPCLILFTPRRYLLAAMAIAFFVAPVYRLGCSLAHLNSYAKNWLLFANTDCLALGGIMAYCREYPERLTRLRIWIRQIGFWMGWTAVAWTIIAHATPFLRYGATSFLYSHFVFTFFFAWAVDRAADGVSGPVGKLLNFSPLRYLGRISYGMYLFHAVAGDIILSIRPWQGFSFPENEAVRFFAFSGFTIVVSSISWYAFERPLNNLKRHFPYRKKASPEAA
jgi:peptidoglycan/LPS O-acetylase OafA/YrhL